jgi:predicted lipase
MAHYCLDLIDGVYKFYDKSIDSNKYVNEDDIKDFLHKNKLKDIRFLYISTEVLKLLGISVVPTTTIIGFIVRKIENPSEIFIVFRGTKTVSEWIKNFNFYEQIDLSKLHKITLHKNVKIGEEAPLLGWKFPEGCELKPKVSKGFYRIYSSWTGIICKNGCICSTICHSSRSFNPWLQTYFSVFKIKPPKIQQNEKGICDPYIFKSSFSKIYGKCKESPLLKIKCQKGKYNGVGGSLAIQILDILDEFNETEKIKNIIITGHSLGGALSQLCAMHLSTIYGSHFVKNMYTFASPRVGNQDFAQFVEKYGLPINEHFRCANISDTVTNIPLPFSLGVCYVHTGNMKYTFQDTSILKSECTIKQIKDIHSTNDYRRALKKLYQNITHSINGISK